MFLLLNPNQFEEKCLIFGEKTRNTVIENGQFTRLSYSTPSVYFNGLCISINIKNGTISEHYNKYKCTFPTYQNNQLIRYIIDIEKNILESYNSSKTMVTNLREHIMSGMIKVFTYEKDIQIIILKISGIWENPNSYGLTYKFIST